MKLSEFSVGGKFDHAMAYELFEAGKTPLEVAHHYNVMPATVRYIHKKWKSGKPSCHMHFGRRPLDHEAILDDLRGTELTLQAIADKYGCTRFTVHKIAKAHKIFRA